MVLTQQRPTVTPPQPRLRAVQDRNGPLLYGAGSLATLLALWLLLTDVTQLVPPTALPSPAEVVDRFAALLTQPYSGERLTGHATASLQRWGLGLFAALGTGIPLGILLARIPSARIAVTPIFELLRCIPPFAWIPIAVLWLGATLEAQAAIVFVAALPVCVINTQLGLSLADPILERAARTLGSSHLRTLRDVLIPEALPMIFTGARTATSNGWMALVGAELVVGKEGLGFLISQGQVNDSPATIVVGMICIGVIGSAIDLVMQRSQRRVTPWLPSQNTNEVTMTIRSLPPDQHRGAPS